MNKTKYKRNVNRETHTVSKKMKESRIERQVLKKTERELKEEQTWLSKKLDKVK